MGKDLVSDLHFTGHPSRAKDVGDVFGLDVDQLGIRPSALVDTVFHTNAAEAGLAVYGGGF